MIFYDFMFYLLNEHNVDEVFGSLFLFLLVFLNEYIPLSVDYEANTSTVEDSKHGL